MATVTNGVNTVTPSKPNEQSVKEMAAKKTITYTVELDADNFNYVFTYKYGKNWFGILSEAKVNAHRPEWIEEQVNKMLKQQREQIEKQLRNKAILAEADKLGL